MPGENNFFPPITENNKREENEKAIEEIIAIGNQSADPSFRAKKRKELLGKLRISDIGGDFFLNRPNLIEKLKNLKPLQEKGQSLDYQEFVDALIPALNSKEQKPRPQIIHLKETILPTKNGEAPETGSGNGMEEKKTIFRVETLEQYLHENGISIEEYLEYDGENTPEMVRKQSYVMFILPTLKKMALVCNEEGNATYIVHTAPTQEEFEKLQRDEEIEENERSPILYRRLSKQKLQLLGEELGIVTWVKWDEENWLEVVENELTREFDGKFSLEDVMEALENGEKFNEEKKRLSLGVLEQNLEILKLLISQIKEENTNSKKLITIPGFEIVSLDTYLERIGRYLSITQAQTKNYLIILQEKGKEKAEEFKLKAQEKSKTEKGLTLSLEALEQNPEILSILVEQIKDELVTSEKEIAIPGYESVRIETYLQRIGKWLNITQAQAKNYLITWKERDKEKAEEYKLRAQEKNKTEKGLTLSLEALEQNPEILSILVEQIKDEPVTSEKEIAIPGYESVRIETYLQRIGKWLKITKVQAREYLITWQEKGKEKAEEFKLKAQEKNKTEKGLTLSLEALEQNPEIFSILVEQIRNEPVQSKKIITISGYESVRVVSYLTRFREQLGINLTQAKNYLITWKERGIEEAKKFQLKAQVENKKEKGLLSSFKTLEKNPEILDSLVEQIRNEPVNSRKLITYPGYKSVGIRVFLERIGKDFSATPAQTKEYLIIWQEQGKEKAEEFKLQAQEKNKTEKGLTLSLEALEQNPEILDLLVEQIKDEPATSEKLITIPGFEIVSLDTYLERIGRYLSITQAQTKNYLIIWQEKGKEKAEEYKLRAQEKNKTEKGLTLSLEALEQNPEILSILVEQIRNEPVQSKKIITISGYESVRVGSYLARFREQLKITEGQAKNYLIIWQESGKALADEKLKEWQNK